MNTPMLIGLAGRARVGKDTAADRLCAVYGLQRLAFADPIKNMIAAMLDIDRELLDAYPKDLELPDLGASPRKLFQTLGTDWGREMIGRDVWLRLACRKWSLARRHRGFAGLVLTDVRMANEAGWIRQAGGVVIHIEREAAPAVRTHVSELPLPVLNGDFRLRNDGSIDELYLRLDDLMSDLLRGTPGGRSPRVVR